MLDIETSTVTKSNYLWTQKVKITDENEPLPKEDFIKTIFQIIVIIELL
jgi:hypothetical protein